MKWFQHWSDSHTNGKMRLILRKHGLPGYAFCWICRELVAKEGEKNRIKAEKEWKITLSEVCRLKNGELEEFLSYEAEIGAIDRKALEQGDLYIPKLKEYSDDYSKRVRRISEQTSDNVPVDKKRLNNIILHYITLKGWKEETEKNPSLLSDIFKRNCRPAKQLLLIANNDELVLKVMNDLNNSYKPKNLSWTLETVLKHFAEFMVKPKKVKDDTLQKYLNWKKELEEDQAQVPKDTP